MASTSPRNGRVYGKATVPRAETARAGAVPAGTGSGRISGRARVSTGGGGAVPGSRPGRGDGGLPPGPPPRGRIRPPGGRIRPPGDRIRPRWGRIALVAVAAAAAIALLVGVGGFVYAKMLDRGLERTDPFAEVRGNRPAKTVDGSLNILMLGSDSRHPDNNVGDNNGAARTDTIIVMHIPKSHDKAYLVSIPRDTYLFVPQSPDGQFGDRRAKINAAFAWGGVPLMIQTVEGFTGLRMDHVVMIDFFGFKDVTDALGGVDMNVERDIKSIHSPFRQFKKGLNHFNGEQALDYVRQRYQFPDGDFARMRHQQEFMKALLDKAVSTGTVTNPGRLNNFLKTATKAITVDKDFSLVDLALQFRNLRSDSLTFVTSPYTGTDTIGGESVVVSDKEKATAMYDAIAKDKMADWVAVNAKPSTKPSG